LDGWGRERDCELGGRKGPEADVTHRNEEKPDSPLTQHFYDDLRDIAAKFFAAEQAGHTLQPTAVVNEACLRIINQGLPDIPRDQQLAIAARILKQVLVDHARKRNADKRGGTARNQASFRLDLDRDMLQDERTVVDFDAVHRALDKLRSLNESQAELVTLRMFSGMSMDQAASVLGLSKRSAEREWTVARAWLRRELARELGMDSPQGTE